MSKTGKTLLIILAVLAAAGLAVVLFVNGKLNKINYTDAQPSVSAQDAENAETPQAAEAADDTVIEVDASKEIREAAEKPTGEIAQDEDTVNLVLIGSDFKIPGTNDRGRGDCTIICSLNMKTGNIRLISVERAIGVYVPSKKGYDLITHAFKYEGGELIENSVEENFLIDIQGYVNADYDALITAVDLLGGIDIELSAEEAQALNGERYTNSITKHRVHEGMNHLDGYDALQYARQRFVDSDFGRMERERKTIKAMRDAAKGRTLGELNDMADQVLPLITTNLSKKEIAELMLKAPLFLDANIESMTVPEPDDYWYVNRWDHSVCWGIDFAKYSKAVKDFIG